MSTPLLEVDTTTGEIIDTYTTNGTRTGATTPLQSTIDGTLVAVDTETGSEVEGTEEETTDDLTFEGEGGLVQAILTDGEEETETETEEGEETDTEIGGTHRGTSAGARISRFLTTPRQSYMVSMLPDMDEHITRLRDRVKTTVDEVIGSAEGGKVAIKTSIPFQFRSGFVLMDGEVTINVSAKPAKESK